MVSRVVAWPGRRLPWSLGELILLTLLAGIILWLRGLLRMLVYRPPGVLRSLLRRMGGLFALAGLLYASFVGLWGLNYLRPPIVRTLNWPLEAPTADELQGLCEELALDANRLRKGLPSDGTGALKVDRPWVLDHRNEGYEQFRGVLAPVLPASLQEPSRPKIAFLSPLMSRSLTYGMYIPWTGEALLNGSTPSPALPFSVCHEMAHQQGIAREDEANFVAYLACRRHPDPLFRYSGARAALGEAMAQLRVIHLESWKAIRASLEPGVLADEAAETAWLRQHQGRFSQVQGRVYDGYLKSQGQADGALSYGRVVDLLIAERRMTTKAQRDHKAQDFKN
ncbi:MAG: DUF3810 domain-containing protein [Acidobacteriota bacterium]|nr:DUF3810 domain-containing protein [Acidobacteriota bacterium]